MKHREAFKAETFEESPQSGVTHADHRCWENSSLQQDNKLRRHPALRPAPAEEGGGMRRKNPRGRLRENILHKFSGRPSQVWPEDL